MSVTTARPQGASAAIWWWEVRRIPFNLALLVVGGASLFGIIAVGEHVAPPGYDIVDRTAIWLGTFFYALTANFIYTLGWVSELLWSNGDTSLTEHQRPKVFYLGFALSIAITAIPGLVMLCLWSLANVK